MATLPCVILNGLNFLYHCVESDRHELMHKLRLMALDEVRFVAIAAEEPSEFFVA